MANDPKIRIGADVDDLISAFAKARLSTDAFSQAVLGMAGRYVGAAALIEGARRSFMQFATLDVQTRRIGLQAGVTAKSIQNLIPEFTRLAAIGGEAVGDVADGFNTLRERTHLSMEETRRLFPSIVQGAYASGTSVKAMAEMMGSVIFNLKISREEAQKTMAIMYAGSQKANVSLGNIGGTAAEISLLMRSMGETSNRAGADMVARLGAMKEGFGDDAEAAQGLLRIYQQMSNPAIVEKLGRTAEGMALELEDVAKRGGNPFDYFVDLLKAAVKTGALQLATLTARNRVAFEAIIQGHDRAKKNADEAMRSTTRLGDAMKDLSKSPMQAVNDLTTALKDLGLQVGKAMDSAGATELLGVLTKMLKTITVLIAGFRIVGGIFTGHAPTIEEMKILGQAASEAILPKETYDRLMELQAKNKEEREKAQEAAPKGEYGPYESPYARPKTGEPWYNKYLNPKLREDIDKYFWGKQEQQKAPTTAPAPPGVTAPPTGVAPGSWQQMNAIPSRGGGTPLLSATPGLSLLSRFLPTSYTPAAQEQTAALRDMSSVSAEQLDEERDMGVTLDEQRDTLEDIKRLLSAAYPEAAKAAGLSPIAGGGAGGGAYGGAQVGGGAGPMGQLPGMGGGGAGGPAAGPTRADRNNNPGNIKYGPFAQAHGATGADAGGFAVFPDRETGFKAAESLLGSKNYAGLTLRQIGARWANGDPNWAATVSAATGIPLDSVPTPEQRSQIARIGMPQAEGSMYAKGGGPGGPQIAGIPQGGSPYVSEQQQGAERNMPLDPQMRAILAGAGEATGLRAVVTSGGTYAGGPRSSSGRHVGGRAADFDLYDENGNKVPIGSPRHLQFIEEAAKRGAMSGGAAQGYMGPYKTDLGMTGQGQLYTGSPEMRAAFLRGRAQASAYAAEQQRRKSQVAAATPQPQVASPQHFSGTPEEYEAYKASRGEGQAGLLPPWGQQAPMQYPPGNTESTHTINMRVNRDPAMNQSVNMNFAQWQAMGTRFAWNDIGSDLFVS